MAKGVDAAKFAVFLKTRKILIADPTPAHRSTIYRVFQDLGAAQDQIALANSMKTAQALLHETKPDIVIAEYELGKKNGLLLIQEQRAQHAGALKDCLFILVTGNTSQSTVARAVEEDIDAFVLKPFTQDAMRSTIMTALATKMSPSTYLNAIEQGKKFLDAGDLDEAHNIFEQATTLDKAPALACFYLSQVCLQRKQLNEAKKELERGLKFNKIHYKCLNGYLEILVAEKNHYEAYEVAKRISQYFPANSKRLADVLRLAIANGKYEDVERYYSLFCNVDEREETLVRYVCAALVVCGKYYLGVKMKSRAMELFERAAKASAGKITIIKQIVCVLLDFKLYKDAQIFLAKIAPEDRESQDYLSLECQVREFELKAAG